MQGPVGSEVNTADTNFHPSSSSRQRGWGLFPPNTWLFSSSGLFSTCRHLNAILSSSPAQIGPLVSGPALPRSPSWVAAHLTQGPELVGPRAPGLYSPQCDPLLTWFEELGLGADGQERVLEMFLVQNGGFIKAWEQGAEIAALRL